MNIAGIIFCANFDWTLSNHVRVIFCHICNIVNIFRVVLYTYIIHSFIIEIIHSSSPKRCHVAQRIINNFSITRQ